MKGKADLIFLTILGFSLAFTVYERITDQFVLSINNYLALALWALVLVIRFINLRVASYGLTVILLLGLFNVCNFFIGRITGWVGGNGYQTIDFNPFIAMLFIAWYFSNRKAINKVLSTVFRGSEKERQAAYQKKVDFYLQQFEYSTPEEFSKVLHYYKDYPPEAQEAISKIVVERR